MTDIYSPRYYVANGVRAIVLEHKGDCITPSLVHGGFVRDNSMIRNIESHDGWVVEYNREEFIQELEKWRGDHCARFQDPDMAAVVLYDVIKSVESLAKEQQRKLTDEEEALIWSMRKRTHTAFEADLLARGITGMPAPNGRLAIPLPPKTQGAGPVPPEWRALDATALADILQRLRGLAGPLQAADPAAVAAAAGWPITERTGNRAKLDARLPLRNDAVWLTVDQGIASIYITITDSLSDTPQAATFIRDATERAIETCTQILGPINSKTGGRWPEWLWLDNQVGVFLRKGSGHAALMVMTANAAAARMRTVAEEARWE